MAIQQPKLAHENQLEPLKFQGSNQKAKANGISFWVFLFSIFISISIFYIFNLSPSSLLHTTKFWFFISNALILIIAADFGASIKPAEIYQEFVEKSRDSISFPPFESRCPEKEIVMTNNIPPQKVKNLQETQEEVKDVFVVDVVSESESRESKKMQVDVKEDLKMPSEESEGKMVEFPPNVDREEEKEIDTSTGNEPNEKGGGGQRRRRRQEDDDDDEFSKMSNEEVNRRVEEFIQRCNRQIRLQAAQNRIRQMQTAAN